MDFPVKNDYISVKDLVELQKICSTLFDNFNGGFGYSNDELSLHQPVDLSTITLSFLTDKPNNQDIATYTWSPNKLSMDDYKPYVKSIRYNVLEVLFEVCNRLGIEFSPDKKCIHRCISRFEIVTIIRKNYPVLTKVVRVGDLDKTKCSTKFLSHNLSDDILVNVKCHEDGSLDLRGKKCQYRIILPDNINL